MSDVQRWAYDIETYPNVFTVCFQHVDDGKEFIFELSSRLHEESALHRFLLGEGLDGYTCDELVGFNNIGFDYPVLHMLLTAHVARPQHLYEKAKAIIESNSDKSGSVDRFNHLVPPSEWLIPQIDLYKIHHFDNKARSTGLKALEFAMRMGNIEELPFAPGSILGEKEIIQLRQYNRHDVEATVQFYHKSREMIKFREGLTDKYQRSFMNHNDTKIGKDFFITELERQGIPCFERKDGKRTPRQTHRREMRMKDVILPWLKFKDPEFTRVIEWLKPQTITETKSVFTDLKATVKGLDIYFGLGGIHASVENRIIRSDDERMILDLDVASYYPNLAITNRFYPAHLGPKFCDIYAELFERRKQYAKGTPQNAALKLALNGVYGDSNNIYSPMYDPLFTMRVTVNGQLLLCKLVDELNIEELQVLQMNTDGITISFNRSDLSAVKRIVHCWQKMTGLVLEQVEYRAMMIRDVNNYLAIDVDGKVKRKGAYDYQREWHQNHSMLIVPKVVEKVLTEGANIAETIRGWINPKDFLILRKVNRDCRLSVVGDEREFIQNTSRYVVATNGKYLFKHMPPLKGKENERVNAVEKGYKVHICNDMKDLQSADIDYGFYEKEVEKLCLILK